MLKLEIGVRNSNMQQGMISFELHVAIRLVKLIYLDPKSIQVIGDQPFYKLPTFEPYVLAEMYEAIGSGSRSEAIPYLKVKN